MFRPQPEVVRHPRRIAFLARFEKQKRPFLVLEAARRLPNVELLFVGGGTLQKELEEKARQWDLKVTFLGRTPNEELPALLNSCALYVLPTMIEGGSPKTLLEAMACGLPVVTADSFGIKECFHHGKHGYRLSDLSPEAWSETIGTLLDQPQLLERMGREARQHVVDHYSVQEAVRREIQVLEEAVALRR
jgi:glycosyltransferase involved in cell wall biosynthesis